MKSLLMSILTLAGLAVFAALVATDIGDLFPAMDAAAWVIVVAGFAAWVYMTLRLETWIGKLRPGRLNEDQRQWLTVLFVFVLGGLALYLAWDVIGPLLAPHFGSAVR